MMHSSIFWGTFLILIGLSMISKALFGFSFPFAKLMISFMLIYLGISILSNGFGSKKCNTDRSCWFETKGVSFDPYKSDQKIETIMARTVIDLTKLEDTQLPRTINLVAIAGCVLVKLSPAIATSLKIESFLSNTQFPDNATVIIGTHHYSTAKDGQQAIVTIHGRVVFGSIKVVVVNDDYE